MAADDARAYWALIADVYELAGVSRRLAEHEARAVGLTAARRESMSVLSGGPHTVAAVARRLGLPRQAVHRVVADLEATGQVQRRANPEHARSDLVELTPAGRHAFKRLAHSASRRRARLVEASGLGPDELDAARTVLRRILDASAKY